MTNTQCEIKDCNKPATRLTTTESSYIEICEDHWYEKYRK
jgi:hypothetical protein